MDEKGYIEWLKQIKEMCKTSMEYCSQRMEMLRGDMEAIDSLLGMAEGQQAMD